MAEENKVPLGKPLPLSDADLDELSKVTPEDISEARKLWVASVPSELARLLDVVEIVK